MVRGIPNISIPTISYTAAQGGGKMSLPVESASLIYSHFEHVSGVPAPQGTQGVTISKLNLLDVLIGQLNQVKKSSSAISAALSPERANNGQPGTPNGVRGGSLDALIEAYRNQIRQARAASAAMPYLPSPSAQSGAVFSLVT